jgi:hypothetical protein
MPAEQTSFDLWTPFQRAVPICTTADLDEEAADEVRAFLEEVAATLDLIGLFDANGWGVWSSVELPRGSSRTEGEGDAVLRVQLGQALREMNQMVPGREDGEAMELE